MPEPEDRDDLDERRKAMEQVRKMDECQTFMLDRFPRIWWGYFCRLREEGFNEDQALSLVKCCVVSQMANNVHVHRG